MFGIGVKLKFGDLSYLCVLGEDGDFGTYYAPAHKEYRWFSTEGDAKAHLLGMMFAEMPHARYAEVLKMEDATAKPDPQYLDIGDLLHDGWWVERGKPPPPLSDAFDIFGRHRCLKCGGRMSGMACNDCGYDVS
jgi:hypothetical protein